MDKNAVHLISSFPTKVDYCKRNQKNAQGNFQKIQITRPTVVAAYNQIMGGTDKMDQLASYYDDRKRSVKWQHRIYNHFLRIAAINAHILYRDNAKQRNKKNNVSGRICNSLPN